MTVHFSGEAIASSNWYWHDDYPTEITGIITFSGSPDFTNIVADGTNQLTISGSSYEAHNYTFLIKGKAGETVNSMTVPANSLAVDPEHMYWDGMDINGGHGAVGMAFDSESDSSSSSTPSDVSSLSSVSDETSSSSNTESSISTMSSSSSSKSLSSLSTNTSSTTSSQSDSTNSTSSTSSDDSSSSSNTFSSDSSSYSSDSSSYTSSSSSSTSSSSQSIDSESSISYSSESSSSFSSESDDSDSTSSESSESDLSESSSSDSLQSVLSESSSSDSSISASSESSSSDSSISEVSSTFTDSSLSTSSSESFSSASLSSLSSESISFSLTESSSSFNDWDPTCKPLHQESLRRPIDTFTRIYERVKSAILQVGIADILGILPESWLDQNRPRVLFGDISYGVFLSGRLPFFQVLFDQSSFDTYANNGGDNIVRMRIILHYNPNRPELRDEIGRHALYNVLRNARANTNPNDPGEYDNLMDQVDDLDVINAAERGPYGRQIVLDLGVNINFSKTEYGNVENHE